MISEELPLFQGGDINAFRTWCSQQITYPEQAEKEKIQGRVVLDFIIEKDGSLSNVEIIRGAHELLDAEAIRVIKQSPKWTPGKNQGKTIRFKYTMPIDFMLQ